MRLNEGAPYTYLWSSNSNGADPGGLLAGLYFVKSTSGNKSASSKVLIIK